MAGYLFDIDKSEEKIIRIRKFEAEGKRYNCTFLCEGKVSLEVYNSAKNLAKKVIEKGNLDVPFSISISPLESE